MFVNEPEENYGIGWVKIYRKIQSKGYYKRSEYVHLWLHLLLKANHRKVEFMWNGKLIIIKEGQLITGRKSLSLETGIPESTIERILKLLENEQQIEQEKTTKFRIITIINWKEYQGEQQADNKWTTNGQQADTNKNDNNNKNDKNYTKSDVDVKKLFISEWSRSYKTNAEMQGAERLILEFGYDKVKKAFRIAGENDKTNISYVRGILNNNGVKNGSRTNNNRRKDYVTKDEYESELKSLYEGGS